MPLAAALICPVQGQEVGRVSPAALPLPLPSAKPLPPDELLSSNPWILPMTGMWKCALTHGRVKAGEFVPALPSKWGITASSSQDEHPPGNAFDRQNDSRWCANSGSVSQWLQADLGKNEKITGIGINWERDSGGYQCRIEVKKAGGDWTTLLDAEAAGISGAFILRAIAP